MDKDPAPALPPGSAATSTATTAVPVAETKTGLGLAKCDSSKKGQQWLLSPGVSQRR
jgi:hypothetical protein